MNFTQEQLDTLQLPIRGKRIKLEVLDTEFQTLATIEGNAIGGSLQKDATNFVRRTGSISLCVPSVASANTFLDYVEGITINVNGKIWLDKNVKIWVGIDNYNQPYGDPTKTVWYNFGICLIDSPVRRFSADGYTMDFNLIDLTAKLNGERSGQLVDITTVVPMVQSYGTGFGEEITTPFSSVTQILSVLADEEYLYMASYGVNFAYAKKSDLQFTSATTTPQLYTIYAMAQNDRYVFCGGLNGRISLFNKATKTFSANLENPFQTDSKTIYCMASLGSKIYIGGQSGYFYIYDMYEETFESIPYLPFSDDIRSICVTKNASICVGGNGGKLGIIYPNGSAHLIANPLSSSEIITSLCTIGSKIYCGSTLGSFGIYNVETDSFEGLVTQNPFSPNSYGIFSIVGYRNNLYCGGSSGSFAIYDAVSGKFGESLPNIFATAQSPITSLCFDSGNIYAVGGKSTTGSSLFCIYSVNYYTETEQALKSAISELTEFKRYTIYPVPEKWKYIPHDIKLEVGSPVYPLLENFLQILSGWQMYLDNEGVFVVEPIPSGSTDIAYPLQYNMIVSDVNSVDFNNVRNQVIVYGRSNPIENIGVMSQQTISGSTKAVITFNNLQVSKLSIGTTILGFKQNISQWYKFNSSPILQRVTIKNIQEGGTETTIQSDVVMLKYGMTEKIPYSEEPFVFKSNFVYAFRIKSGTLVEDESGNKTIDFNQPIELEFLGRQQAQSCIVNGNPESPYYICHSYKEEAHYGEIYNVTQNANSLSVYVNITDSAVTLGTGSILNFWCDLDLSSVGSFNIIVTGSNIEGSIQGTVQNDINGIGRTYTVLQFMYTGNSFVFQGQCPYTNPLILSGGEYDNIYADTLAMERAQYELFLHSNLQNSVTLGCVPDYALDVNYRIPYNPNNAYPPDSQLPDPETKYFITKQVSYPLGMDGSAQTVNAIEIYDDFNYVGQAYDLPVTT